MRACGPQLREVRPGPGEGYREAVDLLLQAVSAGGGQLLPGPEPVEESGDVHAASPVSRRAGAGSGVLGPAPSAPLAALPEPGVDAWGPVASPGVRVDLGGLLGQRGVADGAGSALAVAAGAEGGTETGSSSHVRPTLSPACFSASTNGWTVTGSPGRRKPWPLENVHVLTQAAVLPPQPGRFPALVAGQALPFAGAEALVRSVRQSGSSPPATARTSTGTDRGTTDVPADVARRPPCDHRADATTERAGIWFPKYRLSQPTSQSGRQDLNLRPLDPQSGKVFLFLPELRSHARRACADERASRTSCDGMHDVWSPAGPQLRGLTKGLGGVHISRVAPPRPRIQWFPRTIQKSPGRTSMAAEEN
ncbi:hypothetical protein Kpho01_31190 [Kitasatospora phosalacinea]|uniref:Uncharacterized protein n=1 Tax=Kitasatospora phosalacinea TaxID=2065 RepID=A0A9W6UP99_9ACTN|nr:hypothetical protein Kpho01_31190 [Kitasatospora phosalacinea]